MKSRRSSTFRYTDHHKHFVRAYPTEKELGITQREHEILGLIAEGAQQQRDR
jgi:DNA-binding CsgD family transcriptional regulator